MVVPCWNHVYSRVQATQVGIVHGGPLLDPRVFTCPGHTVVSNMVVLSWNLDFHVSTPPRGVSNMAVPRWNHVFSGVQATQRGI